MAMGMASLTMTGSAEERKARSLRMFGFSRGRGTDAALVTPWSYNFGQQNQREARAYIYTDRPVYRPGHTVHIKAIVRMKKDDTLQLPQGWTPTLEVTDSNSKTVFSRDIAFRRTGR